VFPETQVVNLLDEGLFLDFDDHITPALRRRMSGLICYGAEHGAAAVGLACSVYAPVVDSACDLVDVPVVSSYGPVVSEALDHGRRVGVIASVPATLRDAEYYLRRAASERSIELEPRLALAEDLIPVLRNEGVFGLERRLLEEVEALAPHVDLVVLGQFSFATAYLQVAAKAPMPVLSAPHSSARMLKRLLV
jgi:Asp/Glu/hydantoin racemase